MSGRSSWLPGAASFGEKPAWRGGGAEKFGPPCPRKPRLIFGRGGSLPEEPLATNVLSGDVRGRSATPADVIGVP